jgi:CHASE2 domain-containing sensor protein
MQDGHKTPYGEMRGIHIHANVVSQILSSVFDKSPRPLIICLSQSEEIFLIVIYLGTGALVSHLIGFSSLQKRKMIPFSKPKASVFFGIHCFLLYFGCRQAFFAGYWLPFFQPLTATILLWGYFLISQKRNLQRAPR